MIRKRTYRDNLIPSMAVPSCRGWFPLLSLSIFTLLHLVLTSCSTTGHLPEGEVLYTGISEIAYNRQARYKGKKNQAKEDSTGVITALANAYNAVEGLLTGSTDANAVLERLSEQVKDKGLTSEQRDSIRSEVTIYEKATKTMKEEVEAALAYAPNNSIFGSNSVRWPLPIGLWFYNGFVNDSTRFGRWVFDTFAATPRTISTANPRLRTQVARNTLRNYGFFQGDLVTLSSILLRLYSPSDRSFLLGKRTMHIYITQRLIELFALIVLHADQVSPELNKR